MATIADIMMNAMEQPRATQRLGAAYLQGEENRRKGRLADLQERMVGAKVDQLEYENSPENRDYLKQKRLIEAQKMVFDFKKSASESEIKSKDLEARGILSNPSAYDPAQVEGAKLWMQYGNSGQNISIDARSTQEKEESKEYGKTLVSGYESIRDDARNAETALQQYQMAKNFDVSSGPLEGWKASAVALAANLGFDPNSPLVQQANNVKAYQGVMQNMVLSKMQAQKGPQTENDAKRIESTLATIQNPEEARQFLLDAGMAMEQEKADKHDFWMKWRDTHNGTFDGAESAWRKFKQKTPFLAKNPNTGMPVFFSQFVDAVQQANPNADYGDIVDMWQTKYGN